MAKQIKGRPKKPVKRLPPPGGSTDGKKSPEGEGGGFIAFLIFLAIILIIILLVWIFEGGDATVRAIGAIGVYGVIGLVSFLVFTLFFAILGTFLGKSGNDKRDNNIARVATFLFILALVSGFISLEKGWQDGLVEGAFITVGIFVFGILWGRLEKIPALEKIFGDPKDKAQRPQPSFDTAPPDEDIDDDWDVEEDWDEYQDAEPEEPPEDEDFDQAFKRCFWENSKWWHPEDTNRRAEIRHMIYDKIMRSKKKPFENMNIQKKFQAIQKELNHPNLRHFYDDDPDAYEEIVVWNIKHILPILEEKLP